MPDGPTVQILAFHPFSNLFPMMEGDDFAEMVADIKANGQQMAIMLLDGEILDGRSRYRACIEAGVEPRYEEYIGSAPLDYVLSLNLVRRHLNESQRAMTAAKLATMPHGGDRRSDQAVNLPLVSQTAAAGMLHVSERLLRLAKLAREKGVPELAHRVERGEVAVSLAAKVAQLPEEQQVRIAGLDQRALRGAVKKAVSGEPKIASPPIKLTNRPLWDEQQANLLRRFMAGESVGDQIDWQNVVAAVAAPSRHLRRELSHRLSAVLEAMIKLGLATGKPAGWRVWRKTMNCGLDAIEQLLAAVPDLQATMPDGIKAALPGAQEAALKVLHAGKPSFFPVLPGAFLDPLPKLRFEDPYEVEMCVHGAAHALELRLRRFCLRRTRTAGVFCIGRPPKSLIDEREPRFAWNSATS
jgi:hypothetical protein